MSDQDDKESPGMSDEDDQTQPAAPEPTEPTEPTEPSTMHVYGPVVRRGLDRFMAEQRSAAQTPTAKQFLSRRVSVPVWALLTAGILMLCVSFSWLDLVAANNGQASPNGQVIAAASTATATPTDTPPPLPTVTPFPTATPAPTDTPIPTDTPAPPPTWHTIQTLKGNGTSKTDTFMVFDDKWKIVWSCNPYAYGSEYNLIADLKEQGDSTYDNPVVNVICQAGQPDTMKGETMVYDQAPDFYLDIISEATWTFQIQVYS